LAHNGVLAQSRDLTVHGDGPDITVQGVLLAPGSSAPANLNEACTFLNSAKGWWNNNHLPYYGAGRAHKTQDVTNVVTFAALLAGADYTEAMRAALATLTNAISSVYLSHISNGNGSAAHTGPDGSNILGISGTVTTVPQIAERLNLMRSNFRDHIVLPSYNSIVVHGSSGSVDDIDDTTAPACTDSDIDSIILLANTLRTKLPAHQGRGSTIHPGGADASNPLSAAAVTYPTDLVGGSSVVMEWKLRINAHFPSTSYHGIADSTSLTFSAPADIGDFLADVALIHAALRGHMVTN
jgi:hypothetical protein